MDILHAIEGVETNARQATKATEEVGMSARQAMEAIDEVRQTLPHTIGEASIDAYNELMNMDERSKAKLEYENGEIIIVEFPTRPHERAIGEIERQVTNALYDSHDFLSSRSTSYESSIPGRRALEPDGSWERERDSSSSGSSESTGSSSSTGMELVLVLEIGCSQSMASLRKKAQRWLSETSAREVILIDIGPRAERLVGEIWRRDAVQNPVQEENCTFLAAPRSQYLSISLSNLYGNRPERIPQVLRDKFPNLEIPIDLYLVQQAILRRC